MDSDSGDSSGSEDWSFDLLNNLERFHDRFQKALRLDGSRNGYFIRNTTSQNWKVLGKYFTNIKTYGIIHISNGALDDLRMMNLFRGWTSDCYIKELSLHNNGLSIAGLQSMGPFLQNATNLKKLVISNNNLQSEGFNSLLRALSDSPIEVLNCSNCGIETIEIDSDCIPKNLKVLHLANNIINADGYRGLATLLEWGDTTLTSLNISQTQIDDHRLAILVNALRRNTSLGTLRLLGNDGISEQGRVMLLKLVNDISSIKATLQSNHTLVDIKLKSAGGDEIQRRINIATSINMTEDSPEAAGIEKVFRTQMRSCVREKMAEIQGIGHSVYSEIDPLHLPEVLYAIGLNLGQEELFVALKSTIMGLLSTVDLKKCIQQERDKYAAKIVEHKTILAKLGAKVEELDAKLATMEQAVNEETEHRDSKRRRCDGGALG